MRNVKNKICISVVGYYLKVVYYGIVIIIYGKFVATSFTGFVIVLASDE